MLTRSHLKLSLWSTASALGALLLLNGAVAEAQPAGEAAREGSVIRLADRGHGQRKARPQRPQVPHARAPHGDWRRHTEVQRTENGRTSNSTWTGKDGKTATRDATVVNDREAGTRTRDVTYTGPEGKTRTVNDVTQKTEDGHTRDTTVTNAQGETATRNAVVVKDPESGTSTRDVTYTGVNGNTATSNTTTTRTDSGYIRETTVTGPNGDSGTRSVTVSCDKAAGECTKDVQVEGGN